MAQIMSFLNLDKGMDIRQFKGLDKKNEVLERKDIPKEDGNFAKALEKVSEELTRKEPEKSEDKIPVTENKKLKSPEVKKEQSDKNVVLEKGIEVKEQRKPESVELISNIKKLKNLLDKLKNAGISQKEIKQIDEKLQKGMKLDDLIKQIELLIKVLSLVQNPEGINFQKNQSQEELLKEIKTELSNLKNLKISQPELGKAEIQLFPEGLGDVKEKNSKKDLYKIKVSDEVKESKLTKKENNNEKPGLSQLEHKSTEKLEVRELRAKLQKKIEVNSQKGKAGPSEVDSLKTKTQSGTTSGKPIDNPLLNGNGSRMEDFQKTLNRMHNKMERTEKVQMGKQILDQIGEKVRGFVGKNFSHITIDLKPEALGKIKIVLDMKHDVINGKILVENPEVKELMKEHLHEVRSILEEKGIQLADFEVSSQGGEGFREQMAEDQLQKTIAQNRKVTTLFSRMDTYTQTMEDSLELSSQGIFLEA